MSPGPDQPLVLASSSPYRRQLLERLGLAFAAISPQVDESALPDERPADLVRRLAQAKARALAGDHPGALIIGADQVAVLDGQVLGKPGNHGRAVEQLSRCSGREVEFLTGLCLLNATSGAQQCEVVPFRVRFRRLSLAQVQAYLRREQPYNAAGSFKSEGLGIALFEAMAGEDPTALVGLPLIRLVDMLGAEGLEVLSAQAD